MKLRKKLMATLSACILAVSFVGLQVSAATPAPSQIPVIKSIDAGSETIQPRKDKIDWVYKSENGQVYRRLFNFSKNVWIGDWEVC